MKAYNGSVQEVMQKLADEITSLNVRLDASHNRLMAQQIAITMLAGAIKGRAPETYKTYRHLVTAMRDVHIDPNYAGIEGTDADIASLAAKGRSIAAELEALMKMLDDPEPPILNVIKGGKDD
ncbi:hypothetical protein MRS76_19300 [Rhizobiaceae bacterium n13]|uniref:hypothetical protein n=1 Tax=Ferirhizobium litorale TaxID=2927786 RepID=UPI0024B2E820|nr:hypothetical protein [Fererhizobium litorale]MDI7864099.1 hypothetical protein [Fererhizobium litorale]